jgi:hypothetical protein
MPINRFEKPAESNIFNTYTPLPFEEISRAGQAMQQRYDTNEALEIALGEQAVAKGLDYINIPSVGPMKVGDLQKAQSAVDAFSKKIEDVATAAGTLDKGDPRYTRRLRQLYNELNRLKSPSGELGRAESNLAYYQKVQEYLAKQPQLADQPYRAYDLISGLANYAQQSQIEGQPIPSLDVPMIAGEAFNPYDNINELVKNIEPVLTQLYAQVGPDGYLREGYREEVTPDRIIEASKSIIQSDPQISEYFNQKMNFMTDIQGIDPTIAAQQLEQEAQDLVNSMVQIYSQSTGRSNIQADPFALERARRAAEDAVPGSGMTYPSPITPSKKQEYNKIEFDNNGNIKELPKLIEGKKRIYTPEASLGRLFEKSITEQEKRRYDDAQLKIQEYKTKYPELATQTDKKAWEIITNYETSIADIIRPIHDVPTKSSREGIKLGLMNNIEVADFEIEGLGKVTNNVTGRNNIIKELGYDDYTQFKEIVLDPADVTPKIDFLRGAFTIQVPVVDKVKTSESGKVSSYNTKDHKELLFQGSYETRDLLMKASKINQALVDPNIYSKPEETMIDIGIDRTTGGTVSVFVVGKPNIYDPRQLTKQIYTYDDATGKVEEVEGGISKFNDIMRDKITNLYRTGKLK